MSENRSEKELKNLSELETGSIVRLVINPGRYDPDTTPYRFVTLTSGVDVHLRHDAGVNDHSQQWMVQVESNPPQGYKPRHAFMCVKNGLRLGANKNGDLGTGDEDPVRKWTEWFVIDDQTDGNWDMGVRSIDSNGWHNYESVVEKTDTQSLRLDHTGSSTIFHLRLVT